MQTLLFGHVPVLSQMTKDHAGFLMMKRSVYVSIVIVTILQKKVHCCKSWSAQAWKLLGNVHICPSQFVHTMCTSLDTSCTLELLLGHSMYVHLKYIHAWALAWTRVHSQAVSKVKHSNFYSSGNICVVESSTSSSVSIYAQH